MEHQEAIAAGELRDLLGDFCSGFNVSLTLLSASGGKILSIPGSAASTFCANIRDVLKARAACTAQADRMRHVASDRRDSVIYTCHAGCRCCVHPFVVSGRTVAMATISGFRYSKKPSEPVIRDWAQKVGSVERLQEDFARLPLFSADLEKRMVRLFKVISDYTVSHRLIGLPQSPLFEKIVEYVRSHVGRGSIAIDEVAEHVRKSASTVSHVVKREAGISFKRLVIEQKLQAAESLLREDSERSIGEVADSLGFTDQFYFSRLYKKYRGFPPKEFARNRVG
jgi:AraC-like DNA-binding protein